MNWVKELYDEIQVLIPNCFWEYKKCMIKYAAFLEENFSQELIITQVEKLPFEENITVWDICMNCNLPKSDDCEICYWNSN